MKATEQGRVLDGRYLLESIVASTGLATVWRGRDRVLGRPVIVKVLDESLAGDPGVFERFRQEAVAAARLSHSGIVRVFDTGVDGDTCYVVMELFRGRRLSALLAERGALDPVDAAAIARRVLTALGHAHSEGMFHGDIQPDNILVDTDGTVKVTDFGMAGAAFAAGDATTSGELLGTMAYLAPEQISSGEADGSSDMYSVGAVLYEALTGRMPFEADTLRAGIPPGLEAVVMRALAEDPRERFATAREMAEALGGAAPPGHPHPPEIAYASAASHPSQVPTVLPTPRRAGRGPSFFRSWMLVPLAVAVLGVVAVAVGLAIGSLELGGPLGVRPDREPRGGGGTITPIRVVQAVDHDPGGDGVEHPEILGNAFDGDPSTAWETEGYESADLGGIKDGVGIVFDLGEAREVEAVTVATTIPGWTFELWGSDDGRNMTGPLAAEDGTTSFTATEETGLSLAGVRHRYFMVWITELAQAGKKFRATVAEIGFAGG